MAGLVRIEYGLTGAGWGGVGREGSWVHLGCVGELSELEKLGKAPVGRAGA